MGRRAPIGLAAIVVLLANGVATAQALPEAPVAPAPSTDCEANPNNPGCPKPARVPSPAPSVAPAPQSHDTGSSSPGNLNFGSCGGGGGGDGVAILLVAVVGAALLPVVVYMVDDDASPEAQARWSALSTRVFVFGGATTLQAPSIGTTTAGARVQAGFGLLGVEASAESGSDPVQYSVADASVMLRIPPKAHVELNVAVGVKRMAMDGLLSSGFEVSVPHRYLFGELFQGRVAIDVRPSIAFNSSDLMLSLEAGAQIPLPGPLALRFSARVDSLNHDIQVEGLGGLELAL